MANLTKQEFVPLDISRRNYLLWAMDVKIHLKSVGHGKIIAKDNDATSQDRAKVMIFLHYHPDEGLKTKHLTIKNPLDL